jgi:GTP diphosphokinase / guanosine-3',5'-bis(diphosphate) 3'-diphosphatase
MVTEVAKSYKKYFDLDEIIKNIKKYLHSFDSKKFVKAFEFAEHYHKGQIRKSGKPYILHPVKTVENLVKLHADEDAIIAALLHDVPEDTEADLNQIKKLFGDEVAFLVDGITKLSKVYYRHDMKERQVESLKKLLIHTARDPRVILIKLADRLHNMNTLKFIPKADKRIRISKETLEIYVPIANLLGIQELKSELEDLCFMYLYPEDYEKLKSKTADTTKRQKGSLENMMSAIEKALKKHKIKAAVQGREKSLYSIYKKITSENKTIDDIHDRIALRIITDDKADCYTSLGIIHDIFTPKPGRFKDYIAVPKVNGYQSIHTTVFGMNGVLTEIQIRTKKMHMDAEYGIAAHYFYDTVEKAGNGNGQNLIEDQRSSWALKILDLQKYQQNHDDFLSNLKIDIFQDRIFVFTPEGETIDLPKNATTIDFAYAIHTEVGNHAVKSEINNEIKPITTILKTGDHVNVITSEKQHPELLWLSFAKTNLAQNKIKLYLKKESFKNKIASGVHMLQKELDRAGLGLVEDLNFRKLRASLADEYSQNFDNKKKLFAAIGEGVLQSIDVVRTLKNLRKNKGKSEEPKVAIKIVGSNRKGLMKDVIDILVSYNADFFYSQAHLSLLVKKAVMIFYIRFDSLDDFSEVCQHIEQIEGVERVSRFFRHATISFYTVALTTIAVWALHPLFINSLVNIHFSAGYQFLASLLLYVGLFMLLFTIVYLKKIVQKNFPLFRDVKWVWGLTFFAVTVAVFALLIELYIFKISYNWVIIFGGILFMYAYLTVQYIDYTNSSKK